MFPFTLRKTKGSPLTHEEMDNNFEKSLFPPFLHIQDQKAQGTDGGTFTSGAWQTRDLNTVLTNTISGASLEDNEITLPAGKYYVEASAPARTIGTHQCIIYNTTDSSIVLVGECAHSSHGTTYALTTSAVRGVFSLSLQKTIELRHQCNVTKSSDGQGRACNFTTEVYSDIRIWRIGEYVAP